MFDWPIFILKQKSIIFEQHRLRKFCDRKKNHVLVERSPLPSSLFRPPPVWSASKSRMMVHASASVRDGNVRPCLCKGTPRTDRAPPSHARKEELSAPHSPTNTNVGSLALCAAWRSKALQNRHTHASHRHACVCGRDSSHSATTSSSDRPCVRASAGGRHGQHKHAVGVFFLPLFVVPSSFALSFFPFSFFLFCPYFFLFSVFPSSFFPSSFSPPLSSFLLSSLLSGLGRGQSGPRPPASDQRPGGEDPGRLDSEVSMDKGSCWRCGHDPLNSSGCGRVAAKLLLWWHSQLQRLSRAEADPRSAATFTTARAREDVDAFVFLCVARTTLKTL